MGCCRRAARRHARVGERARRRRALAPKRVGRAGAYQRPRRSLTCGAPTAVARSARTHPQPSMALGERTGWLREDYHVAAAPTRDRLRRRRASARLRAQRKGALHSRSGASERRRQRAPRTPATRESRRRAHVRGSTPARTTEDAAARSRARERNKPHRRASARRPRARISASRDTRPVATSRGAERAL
jgi:hypothetical protein